MYKPTIASVPLFLPRSAFLCALASLREAPFDAKATTGSRKGAKPQSTQGRAVFFVPRRRPFLCLSLRLGVFA
jgi:hypothetical protein